MHMKNVIVLSALLTSSMVFADCRFEIDAPNGNAIANTVHFPRSAANTNDEYKRNQVDAWYLQSDNGAPEGVSIKLTATLPTFLEPTDGNSLTITSEESGEDCNIEVDGDTYACSTWETFFERSVQGDQRRAQLQDEPIKKWSTWSIEQIAEDCN